MDFIFNKIGGETRSYFNFENGVTPINDINLNTMQELIKSEICSKMQLVFPIGSTYITQTNTNPATILEFGTWERLKGKVCLGLDEGDEELNAIGKTGGEKEHTLTIEEMPAHNHGLKYENSARTAGSMANVGTGTELASETTQSTGGGQAHNNMPPFEVVGYMWIRRS